MDKRGSLSPVEAFVIRIKNLDSFLVSEKIPWCLAPSSAYVDCQLILQMLLLAKCYILVKRKRLYQIWIWVHSRKHTAYQIGALLSPSFFADMETCNVLSVLRLHWLQLFIQHDILVSSYPRASTLVPYSLIPRPYRRRPGNEAMSDVI